MSEGREAYEQADEYFKDEQYAKAAKYYDQAIAAEPTNPKYYLERCQNFIKLKNYTAALSDAEAVLRFDGNNKRALFRKGTALFYLDRFAEAKAAFVSAEAQGFDGCSLWIRKCDAEIADQKSNTSATEAEVKAPAPAPLTLAQKVKDSFFQIPASITVTLFARNLTKDQVDIKIENNRILSAKLYLQDGTTYEKTWTLFAEVKGDEMKLDITPYRIEIILSKLVSEDWDGLLESDRKSGVEKRTNIVKEGVVASYPSSAKKKVDLTEAEQLAKKLEEEEKPEGEAALHKLFQQIYSGADEDTRRAMIKSFQTSGGTVLSTNWKEVKDKDYTKDRTAPPGQEFKDWKEIQK